MTPQHFGKDYSNQWGENVKLIKRRVWILVVISILTIAIIMALGIILNNIAIKQLVKSIDENDQSRFDFWINIPYNLNSDGMSSLVCSMTETSFCTPLQKACYNGNHDMIYKLLEHGANANYYESNYNTPLMAVVQSTRNTRNASIQLLLNSGADPNQITPDQRSVVTVLLETKFKESEQVFDLLITNGLDINKEYTRGTALYIACRYRRSDMITYLLPISDVNYQNEYGVTCLMIYLKSKKDIKPKS